MFAGKVENGTKPNRCLREELYSSDINSADFEADFCEKSGLPAETVRELCQGSSQNRPKHFVHVSTPLNDDGCPMLETFRRVRYNWHFLSSSVRIDEDDEQSRYIRCLTPTGDNCGLNVVLAMGIGLQVGRIQRDVVAPSYFNKLSSPTKLFLQILCGPWGRVSQAHRDRAGAVLEAALTSHDPKRFPSRGFQAVQAQIDVFFDKIPQVTWNHMKMIVCCDGKLTIGETQRVQMHSSLYVDLGRAKTMEAAIQAYFKQEDRHESHQRCTLGLGCGGMYRERYRILVDGSNPARLIVHLRREDWVTWQRDEDLGLKVFQDIHLETWSLNQTFSSRYRVMAAIFVIEDSHFTLRLSRVERNLNMIWHFDNGVWGGEVLEWWEGLRHRGAIQPRTNYVVGGPNQDVKKPRLITLVYELVLSSDK